MHTLRNNHFGFDIFPKESFIAFFKNDYVVNIVWTILTAAALYVFQTKYS